VTARRPKRFKVHWRSTEPAARIPQRFLPGTQVVVSGDQPFASPTPLTPFFAFLSGVSQRLPPRTRAVATSGDQQFVDQTLLTPLLAFSSGLRMLVLGLILVALLPNLVLGGLFWLGVINTPWPAAKAASCRSRPPDRRRSYESGAAGRYLHLLFRAGKCAGRRTGRQHRAAAGGAACG